MIRVIGLGSGRCGTTSLAALLKSQWNADCVHERKPVLSWSLDANPFRHIEKSNNPKCDVLADVGFYYLPYVDAIATRYHDARFVCLQRNRADTIVSWERYLKPYHDPWQTGNHPKYKPTGWDVSYPSYPGVASRAEAAGRFYDEYYATARELQIAIPGFRVYPIEALNAEEGVKDILDHCRIRRPVIRVGIRMNCTKGAK